MGRTRLQLNPQLATREIKLATKVKAAPQLDQPPKGDKVFRYSNIFTLFLPIVLYVQFKDLFSEYLFLFFRVTRNQTIAAHDRLTIYFHAVLSKDFKFNPDEDRIFVRAGTVIGKWNEDLAELFVTRYLFFVE